MAEKPPIPVYKLRMECARCGTIVPQRKAFYSEDGEVCGSCFKG